MSGFPITYDPTANALVLDGDGGATVLLTILLKAKFGEAYDPEILFHEPLAQIITQLREKISVPNNSDEGPFSREDLLKIAESIVGESWRSSWSMSSEERAAYIQDTVVAPHRLSPEQLRDLTEAVENSLYWRRRIVPAADASGS